LDPRLVSHTKSRANARENIPFRRLDKSYHLDSKSANFTTITADRIISPPSGPGICVTFPRRSLR
jgi:hypothetical protein